MSNTMWGGRFTGRPAEAMQEINASIDFDRKLAAQDIAGSEAHARHAGRARASSKSPTPTRSSGSRRSQRRNRGGDIPVPRELEDIHMNVEGAARRDDRPGRRAAAHRALAQRPGGARFPALGARRDRRDPRSRSRNCSGRSPPGADSAAMVMPGFTHLQSAQPVTFGHHLMAYVEMLGRDAGRFADARKRLNECPLGAAALAGTSFPIDREMTAKALGFDRPTANSLDGVADRDFALEALARRRDHAPRISRASPRRSCCGRRRSSASCKLSDALHHRLLDHAAEAQSRRRRTGARQDRPDRRRAHRPAHGDEGPAARLFQGHAGGQGARVRRLSTRSRSASPR